MMVIEVIDKYIMKVIWLHIVLACTTTIGCDFRILETSKIFYVVYL